MSALKIGTKVRYSDWWLKENPTKLREMGRFFADRRGYIVDVSSPPYPVAVVWEDVKDCEEIWYHLIDIEYAEIPSTL